MSKYRFQHESFETIATVNGVSVVEQRITELELRYMQQEHTIQDLNEIVCRQEQLLEILRREVAILKEQFLAMAPSVIRDPAHEEPPPHY